MAHGLFMGLLIAVGAGRLVEMRLSRRHQRALAARGHARQADPVFRAMVALHTSILIGAAVEVLALDRRVSAIVAAPAAALFVAANLLRWWVIRTMAGHWNVNVVDSLALGVVTAGPFRWIRHPNYVAVFVELLALPLIGGAYVTAAIGAVLHALVLARRIGVEERVLLAHADYRAVMGPKPRFVPRLVSAARRAPRGDA